jgi:hypothetical protein
LIKKLTSYLPWLCLVSSILGSCIFIASETYTITSQVVQIHVLTLPTLQLLILGCYLATIYIFRKSKSALLTYSILLAILSIYFFGITSLTPLGDHDLLIAHAYDPNISVAEPISYFLYKWIIKSTSDVNYLNLISPFFGIFAVSSYFLFTHLLSKNVGVEAWIFQIALIALPLPFFYTYGYIENTQLSTPFFILFLYFSLQFLTAKNDKFEWKYWCYLSINLSLAILMHGQNWFVMPMIFLLPILKDNFLSIKKFVGKIILSTIIFLILLFILYKLSTMQGWQFFPGSSLGGGDGLRFVPLDTQELNRYATFTMFSLEHAIQISTIMVFSGFYMLAIPILLLNRRYKDMACYRYNIIFNSPAIKLLALASLGYIGFIALWNFDFGFPLDIDLMLTMGVPFSLFNLILISKLIDKSAIKAFLFSASSILSFLLLSQLQMLR